MESRVEWSPVPKVGVFPRVIWILWTVKSRLWISQQWAVWVNQNTVTTSRWTVCGENEAKPTSCYVARDIKEGAIDPLFSTHERKDLVRKWRWLKKKESHMKRGRVKESVRLVLEIWLCQWDKHFMRYSIHSPCIDHHCNHHWWCPQNSGLQAILKARQKCKWWGVGGKRKAK